MLATHPVRPNHIRERRAGDDGRPAGCAALAISAVSSGHARPSATIDPLALLRTIGHGARTTDDLTALLLTAGVDTLIDVRRYPTGRRQPHLSQERLAADLPTHGISYEWWGEALGGRRSVAGAPPPDTGWRSASFAAYSAYMSTREFRAALTGLEERVRAGESLALMCAETVWWRCHRRLIADALVLDGLVVEHIIDRVPGGPHRLSQAALG